MHFRIYAIRPYAFRGFDCSRLGTLMGTHSHSVFPLTFLRTAIIPENMPGRLQNKVRANVLYVKRKGE